VPIALRTFDFESIIREEDPEDYQYDDDLYNYHSWWRMWETADGQVPNPWLVAKAYWLHFSRNYPWVPYQATCPEGEFLEH
jgi:hypothetical protein